MEQELDQPEVETEVTRTKDAVLVHQWRTEQLERLGFPTMLAEAFAGLVDWHQIAALVERGCSPELALDIVR